MRRRIIPFTGLIALLLATTAGAQSLYKYRGPDGEWIYTDRQPTTVTDVEVRELPVSARGGDVTLTRHTANGRASLRASNSLHAPVQLMLLPSTAPQTLPWSGCCRH